MHTHNQDGRPLTLAPSFGLPTCFWQRFHDECWERRATVIARPFPASLAEPEQTFAAIVDACDLWRAGQRDDTLRFFIGETQLLADVEQYLPRRDDESSAGYGARVSQLLGGRRFGLVIEEFQAFDAVLWQRLRDFLRGLYDVTGMPAEAAKATLFLGNYAATPWGLHRGRSGNFQFVVEGPKRIRTWPDAYWRGREDLSLRTDYQGHNEGSTVHDAQSGDIIYWPHDHWHVGEGIGGRVSVAISVALFMNDEGAANNLLARALGPVRRELARASGHAPVHPRDVQSSLPSVTDIVAHETAALRAAGDDRGLRRALIALRLNHATGYGFGVLPARLPAQPLQDDAVVFGTSEYPILWLRDDDVFVCSANGHAFTVTSTPQIVSLLERLNSGTPHRVETLIHEHSGTVTADGVNHETGPEAVRTLLEKLVASRAIVVGD